MTEQQNHLVNLLQQRQALVQEIESLQNQATSKRELLLKVQGAIEYLEQIGITVPQEEVQEQTEYPEVEKEDL